MAGVDEVVLVREAKDGAVDAPLVEELAGVGVLVEDVGSTCVGSQLPDVLKSSRGRFYLSGRGYAGYRGRP